MATRQRNTAYAAILFDLDNTLIATRQADKLACNKVSEILQEKYGIPNEAARIISNSYLKAFRKCPENTNMALDRWRLILWRDALGDKYSSITSEIYMKWLTLRYQYLALTPEIFSLLKELRKHYLLGLITNGPSSSQWEKVQRLEMRVHFDIILVSGDLPWEKPHHEIFHQACQYLGVEPSQCMMVGDKLETDILGGIQANLGGTVWVPLSTDDTKLREPRPDYIIESVTDLPKLLPNKPKVPAFRVKNKINNRFLSLPDLEDCNSNSSDGS